MKTLNLSVPGLAIIAAVACNREAPRKASHATTPTDSAIVSQASAPTPTPVAAKTGNVGLAYESRPAGIKYLDGTVLSAGYDLAHVSTAKGERVWLETIGGKGRTVRAELSVPQLAHDERLFMASCDAKGKLDPNIIAIVVNEPNATRFTKVRQAWRVNVAASRFDLIPVGGIVCEDPGS
jgi:hypothetical protein